MRDLLFGRRRVGGLDLKVGRVAITDGGGFDEDRTVRVC